MADPAILQGTMVQVGAPHHPVMNIFVPFTKVQPWTMAAMLWYLPHTVFVDVSGDEWDYLRFFEARWAAGETFISVEHDVVPGPGLIDSVWGCPNSWCVGHYVGPPAPVGHTVPYVPPFGVVKFSSEFIKQVPDVWAERRADKDWYKGHPQYGGGWWALDVFLGDYASDRGLGFCGHWPMVLHAGKRIDDALYAPVRVTDPDGTLLKDHELSRAKSIELSLRTL